MAVNALPVNYTNVDTVLAKVTWINSLTNISSSEIALHLGDAEALINSRLASRYAVPFSAPYPHQIQALAANIGIYFLLSRVSWASQRIGDEEFLEPFKESLKMLDDIAEGKITLVDSGGTLVTESAAVAGVQSSHDGYLPTFHEGEWVDMIRDEDKLDDILDDRDL